MEDLKQETLELITGLSYLEDIELIDEDLAGCGSRSADVLQIVELDL